MSVAAIPARDWALTAEPSIRRRAIGIAFHQWADFSWALVFFGLLGKWTANLGPASLAMAAVPWAILTSALEWFDPGAFVSVLAADLHIAAALLDRFPGSSFVGIHVSTIRLASSLGFRTQSIRGQNISPGLEPCAISGSWCLRPPRCSPPTIANCHGSGAIQPSTRPSYGICPPIMIKGSCWLRLPPRGLATHIFALSRISWRRVRGARPRFSRIGGQAGSSNRCKSVRRKNARRCPACSIRQTSQNLGRQRPRPSTGSSSIS